MKRINQFRIGLTMACLLLFSFTYGATVHNITQNTHFNSIQAAINDAATVANDVIIIDAGIYNERVIIDKSLTLQGADSALVILTGTGLVGNGNGITINTGITNVTIRKLTVMNFAGSSGNTHAGIRAVGGNNNLLVDQVRIQDNVGASTGGSGFYANGPVDGMTITNVTSTGHIYGARGIVIWNGLKENINISNNHVYGNNCCGIELQDGSASGVTMNNNNVHDNGDNGMSAVGLEGPGVNVLSGNTLLNNGRFGIEIKNPNGSGASSGTGSIVVSNNNVSRTVPIGDARDIVGIAVFRRGVLAGNVDVPTGVQVNNNMVSGYVQTSTSDGFGIVLEGTNHTVATNTLIGNDVGIQRQAGHLPYPGDGNQNNLADQYFGRGNAPLSCGITISGSIYITNGINTRDVGAASGTGIVVNTNTGKSYCSIQTAIDDPLTLNGQILQVSAGTFTEDVNITKAISLRGSNYGISCNGIRGTESIITAATTTSGSKAITISSDGVSIDGFTITNPTGSFGVYAKGRNNTTITNNIISNLGNATSGSGATYGVAIEMGATANISNINISDNCVNNIRGGQNTSLTGTAAKNNNGSAVAIGFGFSTANFDISAGVISNNTISNITASNDPFTSGGKGAYGININVGANGSNNGKVNGALVQNNDISVLSGLWSHGIGLEGETPDALVTNNKIDNLSSTKTPVDAIGVLLEDNAGAGTVAIHENSFTNLEFGVVNLMTPSVDATCNWYGATLLDSSYGAVVITPYLTDGTDGSTAIGFQLNVGQICAPCAATITYNGTPDVCLNATNVFTGSGTLAAINPWISSNPLIASVDNAGVVTGVANGTATITYTEDNGCSATQVVTVNPTSTNTITATACDTYTSPGNNVYTTSGTYTENFTNAAGCDSVLTINLTINNSSSNSISATACDTYTSPSTNYTWTTSGTYMDTLTNANGCDSVLTIALTINNSTSNSIFATACYSYTSPGNNVYTTSGTYTENVTNAVGCDSVLTINLTIYDSTSNTINVLNCPTNINKICVGGSGKKVYWQAPSATLSNPCIPACVGGTAIPGFDYKGTHNGHSYYVSTSSNYRWTQARDAAVAAGGHLVSINNAAENSYVKSIIPSYCHRGEVWIGYNDMAVEGTFEWVNGDMTSYANWKPGEPNNQGTGHCGYGCNNNHQGDHVIMKKHQGRWLDRKNCERNNFVMEIPCANPVTVVQVVGPSSGSTFAGATTTQISYLAYTAAGDSAYCNFDVTVSECTPSYCAPPTYKSNYEYIDRVELGAIDNISGNDGGFGNYVSQSTNLSKGTTVPITLTPGFTNNTYHEYWKIWIDWNYDGDFKDAGEKVAHGHSSNPIVKNINVPNSVTLNKPLRMRVIMKWGGYPTNACGQYCYGWGSRWGEVEDYSVVAIAGSNKMAITKMITTDADPMDQNPIGLVSIYPNPITAGQNEITLQYRVLKDGPVNVSIQAIDGKVLSRQVLNGMEGENREAVALPSLAAGLYTVIISNADGRTMKKFSVR